MLGSLLLTMALGWFASYQCTDCPCQSAAPTYQVGCSDCPCAGCDCPACSCPDGCTPDEEMCCGVVTDTPAKAAKLVKIDVRVLQTPAGLSPASMPRLLHSAAQTQAFLQTLKSDPRTQMVSSPTLLLCNDQTGTICVGQNCPLENNKDYRVSVGAGCRIAVPMLGPVPIALDFGLPIVQVPQPQVTGVSLSATPHAREDGRTVELTLDGASRFGSSNGLAHGSQVAASRMHCVVEDGGTVCLSEPGNKTSVVMMATVHIVDEHGHDLKSVKSAEYQVPILANDQLKSVLFCDSGTNGQSVSNTSSCTRDCPACDAHCCGECKECDTVESNLEKLQRANDLYKLGLLYERLNQTDVAAKVLGNVQGLCPGSRLAFHAQRHCADIAAQKEMQKEWARIWSTPMPTHLTPCLEQNPSPVVAAPANAKCFFVIADGKHVDEQVVRMPWTGNETVLDAIYQIGGLPPSQRIWLARPGAGVMQVNCNAIVQHGDATTNYSLQPNDRLYILSGNRTAVMAAGLQPVGLQVCPVPMDPDVRMKNLTSQSENLREMQRQWEAIWFPNMASHSNSAGAEESDSPVSHTKLDVILSGYHQACRCGNVDRARQLAIEALAIDPTCFAK